MLQPNLQEKSLTSQRIIYDQIKAKSLTPGSIVITKLLRESARKAYSKQRMDQEERQKWTSFMPFDVRLAHLHLKLRKLSLKIPG